MVLFSFKKILNCFSRSFFCTVFVASSCALTSLFPTTTIFNIYCEEVGGNSGNDFVTIVYVLDGAGDMMYIYAVILPNPNPNPQVLSNYWTGD
jgi:hypothetical protein